MRGVSSLDRTRNRIAAGGSLVAGTLALYWLIEILRNQVPDISAHHIKALAASWSILALVFALVARRPKVSNWITYGPLFFVSPGFAGAFDLVSRGFGAPGIVTIAVTCGLFAAALAVREPWRRSAAQPAVAADEAPPRR
jgi:hypothetical protein